MCYVLIKFGYPHNGMSEEISQVFSEYKAEKLAKIEERVPFTFFVTLGTLITDYCIESCYFLVLLEEVYTCFVRSNEKFFRKKEFVCQHYKIEPNSNS